MTNDRAYKTLKRHPAGHGLDPRTYRERYSVPANYPLIVANYAAQRSAPTKAIGLGRPGAPADCEPARGRRAA
ncbi:MucR family transcriptional regulator [Methylobacterium tardum]|uniref:MucR family transcriptional regulator n=1 Tax=Methylobacterium tardum TaxID=374432 RepID=UPI001EDDD393|nr:MucR family transcriptional regulator [Methylobacterium tardum]URD39976.1 MucR family transcriptional regulator [Methylobacterium tardum]